MRSFYAAALLCLFALAAHRPANALSSAAIFDAVGADSQSGIKEALAAGVDINTIQPGSGQSPLMNAVLSGKVAAVKYLLKKGV
jgi:ankyrin repeat protein